MKKIDWEPIQKCLHSVQLRELKADGTHKVRNSTCVLEFHTEQDDKGRNVHQDGDGIRWS